MRSGQLDEAMKIWKAIWRELVVHEKNERMDGTDLASKEAEEDADRIIAQEM